MDHNGCNITDSSCFRSNRIEIRIPSQQKYIDDNRDKTDGKSSVLTTTFTATVPVSVNPQTINSPLSGQQPLMLPIPHSVMME
jgi:hypothetical protein